MVVSNEINTVGSLGLGSGATLEIASASFAIDSGTAAGGIAGVITVANGTSLSLAGTIANTGSIELQGYNTATSLLLGGNTTLTGNGVIQLNDNANNRITSSGGTFRLVNAGNTIAGSGQLGADSLILVNQASGTIDADDSGNGLYIAPGASGSLSNYGLIEATAAGSLFTEGANVVQKTTGVTGVGTIEAVGGGGSVVLSGATVTGGVLVTTYAGTNIGSTGTIETSSQTTSALDGNTAAGAVTLTGSLDVTNNSTLDLAGSVVNQGTILVQGYNTATVLALTASNTLTGGGTVALDDNANNQIYGTNAGAPQTLDNINNTIAGAGQLGLGPLVLVNAAAGTIDATGGNALVVNTGAQGSVKNAGLIEAIGGGGGMVIAGSLVDNTQVAGGVTSDAGIIEANGSNIVLTDTGSGASFLATTLRGGTLVSANGGTIETGGGIATLDGSAAPVTIDGAAHVVNNSTLDLLGSFDLNAAQGGGISIDGYNVATVLLVGSSAVTLNGGGVVTMGDNANTQITGAASADKLVNAGDTIAGGGFLGLGSLSLDNQAGGVIDATGGNRLDLNFAGGSFTNEGLIEATSGNGLELYGGTTLVNTGTVSAAGASVFVDGATIRGGTLATPNGGFFVEGGNTGVLSGVTLTGAGGFTIDNSATADLIGTIANQSTITVGGYNTATVLLIDLPIVRLTGGGVVRLADAGNSSQVSGAAAADKLVNVSNTIEGGGLFGNGSLVLDNQAGCVIDGNAGAALVFNLSGAFTNEGTVEDTGGGGVIVQSGTVTNTGSVLANGGNVTLGDTVQVTNIASGTLTGGVWGSYGGALSVAAGPVGTDAATIILSGGNASVAFGGTAIEASLLTIAAGGTLEVLSGRNYSTANTLSDKGLLLLGGGTLALAGAVSGGGTIEADAGSVLQLDEAAIATLSGVATLNGAGSDIQFGAASPFTTIESSLTAIAAGGTLNVLGGRGYSTSGALSDAGCCRRAAARSRSAR